MVRNNQSERLERIDNDNDYDNDDEEEEEEDKKWSDVKMGYYM